MARAHEKVKAGARLAFMGLPEGVEPAVDIGVRRGDRALPGGIYRVAVGEKTVHGFATILPPRRCRELLAQHGDLMGGHPVRLHHDAATEITFVHTISTSESAAMQQRRIESVLSAFLADELLQELAGAGR